VQRLAVRLGSVVRVKATATSHERTSYGGVRLKDVRNEFSIVTRGIVNQLGKVEVSPPGHRTARSTSPR
jgi:hypothetical protein